MSQLITSNNQQSSLAATWNNAATVFTAWKLNVTDTASNSASLLMDWQVGGTSKARILKDGVVSSRKTYVYGQPQFVDDSISTGAGFGIFGSHGVVMYGNSTAVLSVDTTNGVRMHGGYTWGFVNGHAIQNNPDVVLVRDGVGILAQRYGTSPQTFRLYNTFTDASNSESLEIAHATYSAKRTQRVRARTLGTGIDDIGIAVEPAGNGAFTLLMPDGTATGGNNRGNKAVDLQLALTGAAQVASGANSFAAGTANTASGAYSVALGGGGSASGLASATLGGDGNAATGDYTVATGLQSVASLYGQRAHSAGVFGTAGDAQASRCVLRAETIDSSALLMSLDGAGGAFLTVPTNTCWTASILITAREVGGANHASYWRRCCIENTGGTTALVGTVQTIGTDIETDASWTVTVSANNTTDTLDIEVATPSSETTTRWVAEVLLVEVNH